MVVHVFCNFGVLLLQTFRICQKFFSVLLHLLQKFVGAANCEVSFEVLFWPLGTIHFHWSCSKVFVSVVLFVVLRTNFIGTRVCVDVHWA